jgi:two-component SAPR family response regulator
MRNPVLRVYFMTPYAPLKVSMLFQFTDPIKALEHLKLHKGDYGVIISDLRMPVVNGVQLLKTVKDLNPLARTILVTAYDIDNNFAPRVH